MRQPTSRLATLKALYLRSGRPKPAARTITKPGRQTDLPTRPNNSHHHFIPRVFCVFFMPRKLLRVSIQFHESAARASLPDPSNDNARPPFGPRVPEKCQGQVTVPWDANVWLRYASQPRRSFPSPSVCLTGSRRTRADAPLSGSRCHEQLNCTLQDDLARHLRLDPDRSPDVNEP